VTTQVDVTGEPSVTGPGDDDRLADDITDEMIARLRYLLVTADAKPLPLENAGHLPGIPVRLDVAIAMKRRLH
jgi:hypothetical protein